MMSTQLLKPAAVKHPRSARPMRQAVVCMGTPRVRLPGTQQHAAKVRAPNTASAKQVEEQPLPQETDIRVEPKGDGEAKETKSKRKQFVNFLAKQSATVRKNVVDVRNFLAPEPGMEDLAVKSMVQNPNLSAALGVLQDSVRCNESSSADIHDVDHPIAEGTSRWVAKGTYTSGPRKGQACVAKWFKDGAVHENCWFDSDMKILEMGISMVSSFNATGIADMNVTVNRPAVWKFSEGTRYAGQRHLVEPFIEGWEKFNSNSGWNESCTPVQRAMQALSHFSYDYSNGRLLLCDLQGGVLDDEIVLTDLAFLSINRGYGKTDLGPEGMDTFFSNHTCTEYCKASWLKPHYLSKPRQPLIDMSNGRSASRRASGFGLPKNVPRLPMEPGKNVLPKKISQSKLVLSSFDEPW